MEPSIVEAIFLPWWRSLVYLFALVIGTIAIRITVNFDLNTYLQERKEEKYDQARLKAIEECGHVWTLYWNSPYSRCDRCLCLISTSVLNLMLSESVSGPRPFISGHSSLLMTPGAKEVVVGNYVGKREAEVRRDTRQT